MQAISLPMWLNKDTHDPQLIITDHTFGQYQLNQQILAYQSSAPAPLILTFNQWVQWLFTHHAQRPGGLLSFTQALYIFASAQSLKKSTPQSYQQDYEYYQHLSRYQALPWQTDWHTGSDDQAKRLAHYDQACHDTGQMDASMAFNWLIQHAPCQQWGSILIACTKPLTAPERQLIQSHTQTVYRLQPHQKPGKVASSSYSSPIHESLGVTESLYHALSKTHTHKYAVICPNRTLIHTVAFNLKEIWALNTQTALPMVVSAPQSLNQYPMIHIALSLIRSFFDTEIDLTAWLARLQSQSICVHENHLVHSKVIHHLKKSLRYQCSWKTLQQTVHPELAIFFEKLSTSKARIETEHAQKTLPDWAACFSKILADWYWPGPWPMQSTAQQILNCWQRCWQQWLGLSMYQSLWRAEEALDWLEHCCTQQAFQPQQSFEQARVFIINAQEISTGDYDQVWLVQADSLQWPQKPKTWAGIPHAVKLKHQMPCTAPQASQNYFKQLEDQLLHSAPQINVSYAEIIEQTQRKLAPILSPRASKELTVQAYPKLSIFKHINQFESIQSSTPLQVPRFSSQCLQDFSTCQFKGIAKHILKIKRPELPSEGLSNALRGVLIHEALAHLWSDMKDQSTLSSLTTRGRSHKIHQAIQKVFSKRILQFDWPLTTQHTEIESEIIAQRLEAWLALELERPPFSVIATELPVNLIIENQKFSMRLDRVDSTTSGHVIIDYKTGQAHLSDWFTDRPDNPQMLLYALAYQPSPTGLAYGQLNANKLRFLGIIKQDTEWPGMLLSDKKNELPPWSILLEQWRHSIQQLIRRTEHASPILNPKYGALTCNQCHLHSLCRIKEQEHDIEHT